MTPREVEEYSALRATIRERGSLRVVLFMIAVIAWAAATIATASLAALPVATLLPLFVLAAGFESVFAVHTGVERVGRYLQVFYDDEGAREWERTTMAYGRAFAGSGTGFDATAAVNGVAGSEADRGLSAVQRAIVPTGDQSRARHSVPKGSSATLLK